MMSISPDATIDGFESVEHVLVLLREQSRLYEKLEALATRQHRLVSGDDTRPLLSVLGDRRKLAQELAKVGLRLEPVRSEWSSFKKRMTQRQVAEAELLLRDAGERLQRVIDSDEKDARVLCGRKHAVADSLRKTHSTSEAIQAYRVSVGRVKRLDCVTEQA